MDSSKVLTPQEVADELGIGLNLVYRELKSGTIPNVKCGDRYLISRTALDRWLNGEGVKTAVVC